MVLVLMAKPSAEIEEWATRRLPPLLMASWPAWMVECFSRDYQKEIVNFYGSNEGISLFATSFSEAADAGAFTAGMWISS